MNSKKEKVRSFLLRFFEIYTSREPNTKQKLLELLDEKFNGFGTGIGEFWKNRSDFGIQVENEIKQIPQGYQFILNELEMTDFGNVIVFSALTRAEFIFIERTIILDPIRISGMINVTNEKFQLMHLHFS